MTANMMFILFIFVDFGINSCFNVNVVSDVSTLINILLSKYHII